MSNQKFYPTIKQLQTKDAAGSLCAILYCKGYLKAKIYKKTQQERGCLQGKDRNSSTGERKLKTLEKHFSSSIEIILSLSDF